LGPACPGEVSWVVDLNDDVNEGRMAVRFGLGYRGLKVPDPTGVEEFWLDSRALAGGLTRESFRWEGLLALYRWGLSESHVCYGYLI